MPKDQQHSVGQVSTPLEISPTGQVYTPEEAAQVKKENKEMSIKREKESPDNQKAKSSSSFIVHNSDVEVASGDPTPTSKESRRPSVSLRLDNTSSPVANPLFPFREIRS